MQKTPTIESSEAGHTTEDYAEMNKLFNEHGVKNKENLKDGGEASIRDFSVSKKSMRAEEHKATVTFFIGLPDNSLGKISGEYSVHRVEDSLGMFLSELGPDKDLSTLFGMDFYVVRSGDDWKVARNGAVIEPVSSEPDWDPSKRTSDQKTFDKVETARSKMEGDLKGTGKIVDYYVQRSAGNIVQDLEIGLCILTPDDSLEWYECIHDSECPDEGLETIMSYANAEEIRDLRFTEVPMVFTEEKFEDDRWNFHIRSGLVGSLVAKLERTRLKKVSERRSLVPVKKTYGHANDRDKPTEIRQNVEKALTLERLDIDVHSQ